MCMRSTAADVVLMMMQTAWLQVLLMLQIAWLQVYCVEDDEMLHPVPNTKAGCAGYAGKQSDCLQGAA